MRVFSFWQVACLYLFPVILCLTSVVVGGGGAGFLAGGGVGFHSPFLVAFSGGGGGGVLLEWGHLSKLGWGRVVPALSDVRWVCPALCFLVAL